MIYKEYLAQVAAEIFARRLQSIDKEKMLEWKKNEEGGEMLKGASDTVREEAIIAVKAAKTLCDELEEDYDYVEPSVIDSHKMSDDEAFFDVYRPPIDPLSKVGDQLEGVKKGIRDNLMSINSTLNHIADNAD